MRRVHSLVFTLAMGVLPCLAVAGEGSPAGASLQVGVAGTAPFLNQGRSGISMDLWNQAATELGWTFTTRTYPSVPDALDALAAGQLDAVVGPVTISSARAARFGLTQPYFRSSLSILSRQDELDQLERIKPFFSQRLAYATSVFLLILAAVGALLWLAERKYNEQFPPEPARGIANGM
ncbi:MAG: transporter substrate-binding domain-containing protein [Flavobacteriales bacterium]|nr:transporter substrate-binding domain-containing protein [Flavobacteriales bacterium]